MTELTLSAWLAELVDALSAGTSPPDADDQRLDDVLERGLTLEPAAGERITRELLDAAISALGDAHTVLGHEIAALHRERIDVDRTVRAITAYVKALN